MSTKFTPGPWRMINGSKGDHLAVWIFGKDPGANRELQVISMADTHPMKEHHNRRLADMRLIAAAPEMYEELNSILIQGHVDKKSLESIKALIEKIDNP